MLDRDRLERIRAMLQAQDLGAWIALRPDELVMSLGSLPHWGISLALLPRKGDPILYLPELEPRDSLPDGVAVRTFPWGVMNAGDPWAQLPAMIHDDLRSLHLDGEAITFLEHSPQASPSTSPAESPPLPASVIAALKSLGWRECPGAIPSLYLRKTAAEIDRIRKASRVGRTLLNAFRPVAGMSEASLAGEVERRAHAFTGVDGMRHVRAFAAVQAGENARHGGRFNRSSGYQLREGDLVMMELATCVDGYWSDLTGAWVCGTPTGRQNELLSTLRSAQRAAIDLVRPGASAGDIDRAARTIIERAGLGDCFTHGLGHHTGLRYHDPGPSIAPDATWKLEEGMILTIEPGVYGDALDGGARLEDNVLVTEQGHEVLSKGDE